MWVLTPLVRGASQHPAAGGAAAAAAEAAASQNVNHFLVSGPLVLGRPHPGVENDVPIYGDKTVSARHATLELRVSAAAKKGSGRNAGGGDGAALVLTGPHVCGLLG
jgi:hypothetical protein